jgi:hypothetical protein
MADGLLGHTLSVKVIAVQIVGLLVATGAG